MSIKILQKFVAGELSVKEFENELYTNSELEKILRDPSVNWSGTYVAAVAANLYDYLIALDYSRVESAVNAIGALELFFKKKNIDYSISKKHSEIYNLMLVTQPKYLDIDSKFFEKYILPNDKNLSKAALTQAIKNNFNQYFKFQSKPPKWLQNQQWLIKKGKPLYFVGQLELKQESFHDNGVVYVFLNTETGEIETIKQFY
jgi:hypothetical protein